MHLNPIIPDQVGVLDAFKYLDLISDGLDGLVVIVLEGDLLHGQQLTTVYIYCCVYLAKLTLTCNVMGNILLNEDDKNDAEESIDLSTIA